MKHAMLLGLAAVTFAACSGDKNTGGEDSETEEMVGTLTTVTSPNETTRISLHLVDLDGDADYPAGVRLYYTVDIADGDGYAEVIPHSPLGIVREDADFSEELAVESIGETSVVDETYEMLTGKRSSCQNLATEQVLTFRNASDDLLRVVVRAYDEGVAFRYVFPEENDSEHTVTSEITGFRIPEESRAWMLPYDRPGHDKPAYEGYWLNDIEAGTTASKIVPVATGDPPDEKSVSGWSMPALFRTRDDRWILVAETDVVDTYCGSYLSDEAPNNIYRIAFPAEGEAQSIGDALPSWTLPWTMPWRVIVIGDTLAPIIETNIFTALATPSVLEDDSWIVPGRVSWHWWTYEGMDYNELTPFVDLAAEMTWEYNLVDAEWGSMTNGTWQDIESYAADQGVGIFLWYNGGGDHNDWAIEPRDMMNDPEVRQAEFEAISDAGVVGVKVDFFQSDKQWMMQYYLDILEDAAANELLVNFHGSTIPRGWQRTYPNLMSSEAVKGAEFYKWDATYAAEQPWRNTILPFTRNTVASMDFTPVTFTDNNYPHLTTYGHELALSVVFESGIFHFADAVEGYTGLPDGPKAFLRDVPTTWDDTVFIEGEPGRWIVLARRKDDDWYAAGISGEETSRDIALPLSFLGGDNWEMSLFADGEDDSTFTESTIGVASDDIVDTALLPYGGFAARFTPQ